MLCLVNEENCNFSQTRFILICKKQTNTDFLFDLLPGPPNDWDAPKNLTPRGGSGRHVARFTFPLETSWISFVQFFQSERQASHCGDSTGDITKKTSCACSCILASCTDNCWVSCWSHLHNYPQLLSLYGEEARTFLIACLISELTEQKGHNQPHKVDATRIGKRVFDAYTIVQNATNRNNLLVYKILCSRFPVFRRPCLHPKSLLWSRNRISRRQFARFHFRLILPQSVSLFISVIHLLHSL